MTGNDNSVTDRKGYRGRPGNPNKRLRRHPNETITSEIVTIDSIDPIPDFLLQCNTDLSPIPWILSSSSPHFPRASAEEALLPHLLRFGSRERGMMCRQPPGRIVHLKRVCQQYKMPFSSALSLRRLYIKHHNRYSTMERLGLGSDENIRAAAQCFEEAVQAVLQQQGILFWSEHELRNHYSKNNVDGTKPPPTPDFLLKQPILLKRHHQHQTVHWIEAKMFYGASTLPQDGKGAVETLHSTACKYVHYYGPGAIIFLYGCGHELALQLQSLGVMALDATSIPIDRVLEQQKTWCADNKGNILI